MLMDRHPELQYIGIVYRGQEFGALAITPDGQYLKVNGDMLRHLNAYQVDDALQRAGAKGLTRKSLGQQGLRHGLEPVEPAWRPARQAMHWAGVAQEACGPAAPGSEVPGADLSEPEFTWQPREVRHPAPVVTIRPRRRVPHPSPAANQAESGPLDTAWPKARRG